MLNAPLSPRMLEVLEKAADAFIKNTNPFDVEWLTQYDITLQECVDLSELIGVQRKSVGKLDVTLPG